MKRPVPGDALRPGEGFQKPFNRKGLYEALKQGPGVTPEPLDDNAVEITLVERRQQRQAPREIWTVVPAMPRMGP